MGLFSKDYNKNRISINELRTFLEASFAGAMFVTSCEDDGKTARLVMDSVTSQFSVDYQRELSRTAIGPYDMYYDGPLTGKQITRTLIDGIGMPSVDVNAVRIGNSFSFGVFIDMNHRYFSYDEVEKNLERLGDAYEKAFEVLAREGIVY